MSRKNTFTPDNKTAEEIFKELCHGLECTDKYTDVIQVDAGIYGKIKLKLCKNCLNLFK